MMFEMLGKYEYSWVNMYIVVELYILNHNKIYLFISARWFRSVGNERSHQRWWSHRPHWTMSGVCMNGMFVVCLWYVCCVSVVCLLCVCGVSGAFVVCSAFVVCLWCICYAFVVCFQCVCDLFVARFWCICCVCGVFVVSLWCICCMVEMHLYVCCVFAYVCVCSIQVV